MLVGVRRQERPLDFFSLGVTPEHVCVPSYLVFFDEDFPFI